MCMACSPALAYLAIMMHATVEEDHGGLTLALLAHGTRPSSTTWLAVCCSSAPPPAATSEWRVLGSTSWASHMDQVLATAFQKEGHVVHVRLAHMHLFDEHDEPRPKRIDYQVGR